MKNKKIEFTEEEVKFLKSIGEYKNVQILNTMNELLAYLPKDPKALLERIDKEIPEDPTERVIKLKELVNTDREFATQYLALYQLQKLYGECEHVVNFDQECEDFRQKMARILESME